MFPIKEKSLNIVFIRISTEIKNYTLSSLLGLCLFCWEYIRISFFVSELCFRRYSFRRNYPETLLLNYISRSDSDTLRVSFWTTGIVKILSAEVHVRSCYSKAEKCSHIPRECHSKEQGSIRIIDGIRDSLTWSRRRKQTSSIDESVYDWECRL